MSESVRIRCQKIMSKYNLSIQYKGNMGYCFLDSFNGYYIDDNGKRKAISKNKFIKYLVSLFMVGFSLALPLYLYDNYEKNN